MSDFDDQQFQQKFSDLIKSLDKLVDNLNPNNRRNRFRKGNWAEDDLKTKSGVFGKIIQGHNAVKKHTDKATDSITKLAAGSNDLLHSFKELAEVFVLGKVFSSLITGGEHLAETYNKLSSIGQNFGGSMTQMALQAAQAGVPLGVFSELLQRNATAAAVMANNSVDGSKSMGMFAKGVTQNLKTFGFYGMNIQDINNMTSDYAETLRKQNLLTGANTKINTASIVKFASDLSDFSAVTGKAKEDIEKDVNSALQDTSLNEVQLSPNQMKQMTGSASFLASLPGETGTQFSQMLSQTVGLGAAFRTNQGQTMINAGAGQLVPLFQQFADKTMNGGTTKNDYVTLLRQLQGADQTLMPELHNQIMAGNENAIQLSNWLQSLRGIDPAKFAADQAREDGLTKFFNTLQSTLYSLESSFSEGFYAALKPVSALFGNAGDTITNNLGPAFKAMGTLAAQVVDALLSKPMIAMYKDFFTWFGAGIQYLITQAPAIEKKLDTWWDQAKAFWTQTITTIKTYGPIITTVFGAIAKVAGLILTGLSGVYKTVGYLFDHIEGKSGTHKVGTAVAGTALIYAAWRGAKMLFGKLATNVGKMTVNAAMVFLNSKVAGKGGWMIKSLYDKLTGNKAKTAETLAKDAAKAAPLAEEGLAATGAVAGEAGAGAAVAGEVVGGLTMAGLATALAPLLIGTAVVAGAAVVGYGAYKLATSTNNQYKGKSNDELQKDYQTVQAQLVTDNKNVTTATGKEHAMLLGQIQGLLKQQLELQSALGIQQAKATTTQTQEIKKHGRYDRPV